MRKGITKRSLFDPVRTGSSQLASAETFAFDYASAVSHTIAASLGFDFRCRNSATFSGLLYDAHRLGIVREQRCLTIYDDPNAMCLRACCLIIWDHLLKRSRFSLQSLYLCHS